MDGLSSGASVLAVVSIAVQLADSVKRIYDFWSSVKDAPNTVREVTSDLSLLVMVLSDAAAGEHKTGGGDVTEDILSRCQDWINDLFRITKDLEGGLASTSRRSRKWTAVKSVFKEDKIRHFKRSLEEIKSTLLLARQSSLDSSVHQRLSEHRQMLVSVTENVASLHLQPSGPAAHTFATSLPLQSIAQRSALHLSNSLGANTFLQSALETGMSKVIADVLDNLSKDDFTAGTESWEHVENYRTSGQRSMSIRNLHRITRTPIAKSLEEKKTIFGSVRLHTRRYKVERQKLLGATNETAEEEESVTWVTVRPAPWVVAAGIKYGVNMTFWQTSTSWKHALQTFQPVPNDAEIFKNVQRDDEETVWELISEGKASIWDMNDVGRTPLMEAGSQPLPDIELCRRLIEAGSDPNLMDNWNWTPLRMQVHFWEKPSIEVVRFWLDAIDIDERELLHTLRSLAIAARKSDTFDPTTSPFVWLWNLLQLKLDMERYEALVYHILYRALPVENKIDNGFLSYVVDLFEHNLDATPDENRYTVLFQSIQMELYPSALLLIEKGANLHAAGYDHEVLPRPNNHGTP